MYGNTHESLGELKTAVDEIMKCDHSNPKTNEHYILVVLFIMLYMLDTSNFWIWIRELISIGSIPLWHFFFGGGGGGVGRRGWEEHTVQVNYGPV